MSIARGGLLIHAVDELVEQLAADLARLQEQSHLGGGGNTAPGGQENIIVTAQAIDALVGQKLVDSALEIAQVRHRFGRQESIGIEHVVAKASQREFWHVRGEHSNVKYFVIQGFCSCPSFAHSLESNVPICKHLLAVKFASNLKTVSERQVEDAEYGNRMHA